MVNEMSDVPLYNVVGGLTSPRKKYHRLICDDLQPVYADDEIGVIGIDTSRSLTFKSGRIHIDRIARLRAAFDAMPALLTRVLISHHPFDLPESYDASERVGRARLAMGVFVDCGVDLLLAGHLHASHAGDTRARYSDLDNAALVVQAGTPTSTRGRGEANAFNVIDIESARITVPRYAWHSVTLRFEGAGVVHFGRRGARWQRLT